MTRKLISALVTPFDDNNSIDFFTLDQLIGKISQSHTGFLINGSTGEGDSLSIKEMKDILNFTKQYSLKKIIAIPEDNTDKVVKLIKYLQIPNDYQILVRTPSYYLPTQIGIYKHFEKIFLSFPNKQFIIYQIPKRTGSKIDLENILKLKNNYPNFVAIKDCTNDFELIKELSKCIDIYSGVDENYLEYLKAGANGLISVQSIIYPSEFQKIELYNQNYEQAINAVQFIKAHKFSLPNPIGIKKALKDIGYKSMNLRLPLSY